MKQVRRLLLAVATVTLAGLGLSACGGGSDSKTLTIYSGREEDVVAPLYKKFEAASGIKLDVRYGASSELAAQLEDEGDNSPADVFFAQDAGAIGSVADRLIALPTTALDRIPERYRDPAGHWVGTSGRSRVVRIRSTSFPAVHVRCSSSLWNRATTTMYFFGRCIRPAWHSTRRKRRRQRC